VVPAKKDKLETTLDWAHCRKKVRAGESSNLRGPSRKVRSRKSFVESRGARGVRARERVKHPNHNNKAREVGKKEKKKRGGKAQAPNFRIKKKPNLINRHREKGGKKGVHIDWGDPRKRGKTTLHLVFKAQD